MNAKHGQVALRSHQLTPISLLPNIFGQSLLLQFTKNQLKDLAKKNITDIYYITGTFIVSWKWELCFWNPMSDSYITILLSVIWSQSTIGTHKICLASNKIHNKNTPSHSDPLHHPDWTSSAKKKSGSDKTTHQSELCLQKHWSEMSEVTMLNGMKFTHKFCWASNKTHNKNTSSHSDPLHHPGLSFLSQKGSRDWQVYTIIRNSPLNEIGHKRVFWLKNSQCWMG